MDGQLTMKKYIIKYWYLLPLLLALLMLALTVVLITIQFQVLERIIQILLLLTLIALPISWVVLLVNKEWRKLLISITTSILVVCVLFFPLGIAIASCRCSWHKITKEPSLCYSCTIQQHVASMKRVLFFGCLFVIVCSCSDYNVRRQLQLIQADSLCVQ